MLSGVRPGWFWELSLSRVTSLVAVRAAVLGFDLGPLCSSISLPVASCPVWLTVLGGGWKAGRLYHTSHAGSALYGGKVAILVLELLIFKAQGLQESGRKHCTKTP